MQPGAVAVADEDEGARPLLSMKAKSSAPITGGTSASTLSLPAISRATSAAKSVCRSWLIERRVAARVGELRRGAVNPRGALDDLAEALFAAVRAPRA